MKQKLKKIYQDLSNGKLGQKEALEKIKGIKFKEQNIPIDSLFVRPNWVAGSLPTSSKVDSLAYTEQHIIICGLENITVKELDTLLPKSTCLFLLSEHKDIAARYSEAALTCFEYIQKIIQDKSKGNILIQVVTANRGEQRLFAGLSGLLKTVSLESSHVIGQVILTEPDISATQLVEQLQENKTSSVDAIVNYEQGKRQTLRWETIALKEDTGKIAFKKNGVYLVTGGLGSLGVLFAKDILQHAPNATVILTGRSALNDEKQILLASLPGELSQIRYEQLDVGSLKHVTQLISKIKKEYKQLSGIIHSAGMLLDNFILKKTAAEFSEVLAPKVTGAVNLDLASQNIDLDFFVLFSSVAGAMGNIGQADYATANSFLDQFAGYRNQQVADGQRKGHTLSINWPLWAAGGMRVDQTNENVLRQTIGMVPMQSSTGLQTFHRSLMLSHSQILIMEGNVEKMQRALVASQTTFVKSKQQLVSTPDSKLLHEKTLQKIKRLFGKVVKLSVAKIDEHEAMSFYGIDSIMITQLNHRLTQVFGDISKTLFYEHQTLEELTVYFVKEYPNECLSWSGLEQQQTRRQEIKKQGSSAWPGLSSFKEGNTNKRASFISAVGDHQEPVAIIGISGIYPQASTLEEYWENLKAGKNCISEIPSDRWALEGFYEPDQQQAVEQGKSYSKWGGFIEQFSEFDSLFFGISPREAMNIDPQERLFLQAAWQALENSGYTRSVLHSKFKRKVGVFAGITKTGFSLHGTNSDIKDENFYPHTSFGSVANRLSYFLNITGPSMPIDTMCSSSLTAIHEACEHIHRGECDIAFAGGVNLYLHPSSYVSLCSQNMLSREGLCKSFGEGGNGFVPGEGVGVVLLKSLSTAIRDNDLIHGVVLATHVNHGGKTNGYTVPSPKAQAELIRHTIDKAGINARDISYIEAHGTGTELGDPIEISGLQHAFAKDSEEIGYCKIGSAKSNIGHLEAAAGVAGLTKVLLQMKHGQIAPSLHATNLNPNINFDESAFSLNQTLTPWQRSSIKEDSMPRIAGISSFGAGGANAHILVQEYEGTSNSDITPRDNVSVIIPLSARTPEQLQQRARDLLAFIRTPEVVVEADNDTALNATLLLQITTELASLLEIETDQLDSEQSLHEYGVERLHLSQLFERLSERHDLYMTLEEGLEQESIAGLVDYCAGQLNATLSDEQEGTPVEAVGKQIDLRSVAYTLQVGREGMDERLGFIVDSLEQLEDRLEAYLDGEDGIEEVYQGQVKGHKEALSLFSTDADLQETIDKWIAGHKLPKLLDLWVKGLSLDWQKLYSDDIPQRISLPTYPFAKERYWVESPVVMGQRVVSGETTAVLHPLLHTNTSDLSQQGYRTTLHGDAFFLSEDQVQGQRLLSLPTYPFAKERYWVESPIVAGQRVVSGETTAVLHPLLHTNTSDLSQQCYRTTLRGGEFFLKDHQVQGQCVLPGVAYLEMARAAVMAAVPSGGETVTLVLQNIVWAQPVVVSEEKDITIGLFTNDNGQIDYEVYSTEAEQETLHCQGSAVFINEYVPASVDVQQLKGQMHHGSLDTDRLYAAFNKLGLDYGPSHRGVTSLYRGEQQLLAYLSLPTVVQESGRDYFLHPSLMDSALQASIGLITDLVELPEQPSIPFALESLTIVSACTQEMVAWIRYSPGSVGDDKVTRLDIDLCDVAGNVCVQMRGFSSRVLKGTVGGTAAQRDVALIDYQARAFSYNMPLLQDHSIGFPLLVGATYLSMMIESGQPLVKGDAFTIEKVLYSNPLTLDIDETAQVSLQGKTVGQQVHFFAVYTKNNNLQPTQSSEGVLNLTPTPLVGKESFTDYVQHAKSTRKGSAFYLHPKQKVYGPSLRNVEDVYTINDTKVVGKIQLTATMVEELPNYVIHPCIFDACHVVSTFSLTAEDERLVDSHGMPMMIEKVSVKADFTQFQQRDYFCVVEKRLQNEKIARLDIQLFSMAGELLCVMTGFTTKKAEDTLDTVFASPVWQESPVLAATNKAEYTERHIVLCEMPEVNVKQLDGLASQGHCLNLSSSQTHIADRYQQYALSCFELIQKISKDNSQGQVLIQIVAANKEEQTLFAGLIGLLKTASLETPRIVGQIILVEPQTSTEKLLGQLQDNQTMSSGAVIKYQQGTRHVLSWQEVQAPQAPPNIVFKDKGVYLITGGLGGLGMVFAEEIFKQTTNAKVILTGRSKLDDKKQRLLGSLSGQVDYQQLDICNLADVKQRIASIKKDYKQLNGIIHCAGMVLDSVILKKTGADFSQVLAPKVTGTVNLDQASEAIELDFMVLFSSVVGAFGNVGQADYAAANGFMDQFAAYRNQRVATGQRRGNTLSINWPLWQAGGMSLDKTSQDVMRQATGMLPMQVEEGLQAFHHSMRFGNSQMLVMQGLTGKIRRHLFPEKNTEQEDSASVTPVEAPQPEVSKQIDTDSLLTKIQALIIKEVSRTIKLSPSQIQLDMEFDKYGFDSILLTDFVKHLNQNYELELMPTIFFEYATIGSFSDYLTREYESVFAKRFSVELKVEAPNAKTASPEPVMPKVKRRPRFVSTTALPSKQEDIAVIGMDGCFAESQDIETFWDNIVSRKNLIKEVPLDHWDYRPWYDENRDAEDKTYCKWGSFIDDVDTFDPAFFNISPREAEWMDPQMRLLLQSIYKTSEDAGLINQIRGSNTGVFVGVCFHDYADKIAELNLPADPHSGTGNAQTVIANRVSFLFNLTGPSLAIDTACSSSLFALHQACHALRSGECNMAFVGGVNLLLSSLHYRYFSSIGALSPTGRCHTFDAQADGYVPGEAIASVLLKPLTQALEDGDKVYAVIKGSAALHGGATQSLTAPDVSGEKNVLVSAWKNAGIDPSTLSYIEAHGTGTNLGDPIEVSALTQAFKEFTKENGFCAIGSAKSNIGHAEGAAGIVGVIKVIEQMRNKQIPAMPFFEKINPYLKLDKSPLYINEETIPWVVPSDHPRRAGVSSFGFSGAYAHAVIEEYPSPVETSQAVSVSTQGSPVIIPLSARTPEQLQQRARDLLAFIRTPDAVVEADNDTALSGEQEDAPAEAVGKQIDLRSMAYTLQVGREGMDERLGFIVESLEQLEDKLEAYLEDETVIDEVYRGQVKGNKEALSLFSTDTDLQETIDKWIAGHKLSKLLDLWVKGLALDWEKLYGDETPQRMSLPTYPFAKERYWVEPPVVTGQGVASETMTAVLHPLVHTNTSSFNQQSYCTTLCGDEFFLRDHQVQGQKVLPAVAHLEMARAAIMAAASMQQELITLQLYNVIWLEPIVVTEKTQISIVLSLNNEQVDYEIYSVEAGQEVIHCQGSAVLSNKPQPTRLDIAQLQGQMEQSKLERNNIYNTFTRMGVDYGSAHQCIERLYFGNDEEGRPEVLAKLVLPASVSATKEEFILHPSILDSAVQASFGVRMGETVQPSLPVALESLEVIDSFSESVWAWVRLSAVSKVDKLQKLDIDLIDDKGTVCARIKGMEIEYLQETSWDQLTYLPKWERQDVIISGKQEKVPQVVLVVYVESSLQFEKAILSDYQQNYPETTLIQINLCNKTQQIAENVWHCDVKDLNGFVTCLHGHNSIDVVYFISELREETSPVDLEYLTQSSQKNEIQLLRLVKCLAEENKINAYVDCYILTLDNYRLAGTKTNPYGGGVTGLAYSIAQGDPRFLIRNIDLSLEDLKSSKKTNTLVNMILHEEASSQGDVIKFKSGCRYQQSFFKLHWEHSTKEPGLKTGGVYVILGGSGTVGRIITRYLMEKYNAKVVWIGRTATTSKDLQEKIASFDELGVSPLYIQADVTQFASMEQAVKKIKTTYPEITGAIFSGLVFDFENSVAQTTEADFQEILSVKTKGSLNFYRALAEEHLEFLCYFSSGQAFSFSGAAKLSAYAAGITFSDIFVQSIQKVAKFPVGTINWGFWKSSLPENFSSQNISVLEEEEGAKAFERFVALLQRKRVNQVLCLKASEAVLKLMNCAEEEVVSIHEKGPGSLIETLMKEHPVVEGEIDTLEKEHYQEELV